MKHELTYYSDEELILHYHHYADERWAGQLLERYTIPIFGVCMKYLKNSADAKDVTQQIFEKVLIELEKNYPIPHFKAWLYTVAKNACLMSLRKSGLPTVSLDAENLPPELEDIKDEESGINQLLLHQEHLKESLQELNKEQRLCIELFYLQKKSYKEIEEETGYSFREVKSHIQNGKRNLKIKLLNKSREV